MVKNKKNIKKITNNKFNIDFLQEYTNWKKNGAFSGSKSFYKALKQKHKNLKYVDVMEWLRSQDTYTLYKNVKKKFKRGKIIVPGPMHTFQLDLCDMRSLSSDNNNYAYILTVIDVFSKKGWAVSIKNKKGITVLEAIKQVLEKNMPQRIHADQGLEFFNKDCKSYLKKHGIELYFTNSEMKAAIVERFNRTIKDKMWRYFEFNNSFKYIDILDDLINSYNNTYHRSIKTTPNKVTEKNKEKIFFNLYGFNKNDDVEPQILKIDFKIDDYVRISKNKGIFGKGYENSWRREIFQIEKILYTNPVVFLIKDLNNESIQGKFYSNELQKVYISDDNQKKKSKIKSKQFKKVN